MNPKDLPPVPPMPPQPPVPGQAQSNAPAQPEAMHFLGHDPTGKPLYGIPPAQPGSATSQPQSQQSAADNDGSNHQFVHFTRQITPDAPPISEKVKQRHEQSKRQYPWLNLTDGEYVISFVRRHMIGLLLPVGSGVFLIALIISIVINYGLIMEQLGVYEPVSIGVVALIGICLSVLIGVGVYFVVWVYLNNRFFLTNESVIQEIQISLFSKREQTVSLNNIEDASYSQRGIIQVCRLDDKSIVQIDQKKYTSSRYSKDLEDCQEEPEQIEVCNLETNQPETISEDEFDETMHSRDLTACQDDSGGPDDPGDPGGPGNGDGPPPFRP